VDVCTIPYYLCEFDESVFSLVDMLDDVDLY